MQIHSPTVFSFPLTTPSLSHYNNTLTLYSVLRNLITYCHSNFLLLSSLFLLLTSFFTQQTCFESKKMPSLLILLTFFLTLKQSTPRPTSHSVTKSQLNTHCNETCGGVQVTFPFYISNASCGWSSSFQLSCLNSTSLFLNIDSQNYRVIQFFPDGVLVDFPGFSNVCRPYNDLKAFGFSGNDCFGISSDNVIGLYDCEDSSLCKANCEANDLPDCDGNGNGNGNSPACCYPLSDHSVWQIGDGFGLFSKFECRGFSSWVVPRGVSSGKRGVKLEWSLPLNLSTYVCDVNARTVNATTVKHGIRCVCDDGFVGDGYVNGTKCLKSCFKDGKEEFGEDCEKRHHNTKIIIVTGVLASVFAAASLITLLCLIKKAMTSTGYGFQHKPHFRSTLSFRKSCNTRIFTLNELDEATTGFNESQKLMDNSCGSVFMGTLKDGTHIAVQKVHCENEHDLLQVLTRIELLSSILHRHLAHIFGCCIDFGHIPMVVYEFPQHGTLEDHLHQGKEGKIGLDWYKRLSISAQTASLLAFLQHEITPAIFHHDLKSSSIFLDQDYNVKVACFGMLSSSKLYKSDVYGLGLVLLEVISGSKQADTPTTALQKISDGKLEEVLDPLLYYHEQPPLRKDEIEIVADIATRCLLFGGDGKLGMVDVARELVHLMKASIDGGSGRVPALEETFSNSSLLQMISMSPDSIHLPRN